ncbi:hypothetical protein COP1_010913 [Malus domestica]
MVVRINPSQYTEKSSFQQEEQRTHRKQRPAPETRQQPPPREDGKEAAIHASSFFNWNAENPRLILESHRRSEKSPARR